MLDRSVLSQCASRQKKVEQKLGIVQGNAREGLPSEWWIAPDFELVDQSTQWAFLPAIYARSERQANSEKR